MAGKRVRSDAKSQTKKKRAKIIYGDNDHRISRIIYGDDDRISQLPDDILLQILSSLSLKEAVGTSVLSSRWQNLWKQIPCLNFDKHICLKRIPPALESCRVKREKHVKWVNRILKSHKATTLKEFRICLTMSRTFQKEITQWLKYALARHVQSLEFDLTLDDSGYLHCVFPKELFTQKYSSKIDFKSLRVLTFKSVNMTNEDFGFLLSNCTSLEKLALDRSHEISDLEVCGPSLVLKHLELTRCYNLNSVKISAPNLTSLILQQEVKTLLIENVPKLVDLSIYHMYGDVLVKNILPAFSCCISQLEILTMELTQHEKFDRSLIVELPPKLKKLVVIKTYEYDFQFDFWGLTDLIRASPYLHEFCLELKYWERLSTNVMRVNKTFYFPHEHLKVFKFCGYCGQGGEVDILTYIFVNCVALEKVIIGPNYKKLYDHVPECTDKSIDKSIKKQAVRDYLKQRLKTQVPEQIELVVL